MGTSQSSKGPAGKVPLVPSWIPPLDSAGGGIAGGGVVGVSGSEEEVPGSNVPSAQLETVLTPERGFAGVRRNLGTFASTGSTSHMRQGLSQYVRTSYGGSGNATRRHGATIKTAVSLYNALSPSSAGGGESSVSERPSFEGRSAEEILNAVVEAVRPVDGTQDAEASRASIHDALSDLLNQFPDASLLDLTEEQRMFAIERYLATDVYRRFNLDLGVTIQKKAPDTGTALARLKEVRDYIRETVAASFRQIKTNGQRTNTSTIGQIVQSALTNAFQIFESYTR